MKTDVIVVSSRGNRMEEALRQVDKIAAYKELSDKSAMQLRLLTEETMGLMRAITGETEGEFWIEDDGQAYELHLRVKTRMNSAKRDQLLSTSTRGVNESAKGLMGRLLDFFDREMDEDIAAAGSPLLLPDMYESGAMTTLDWEWSMNTYQNQLAALVKQKNEKALEMWDELEKSVVTHVADDIKVSIRGQQVEMTILKKLD